jgi:hypothetical protein
MINKLPGRGTHSFKIYILDVLNSANDKILCKAAYTTLSYKGRLNNDMVDPLAMLQTMKYIPIMSGYMVLTLTFNSHQK